MERTVVITGIGLVTPLGDTLAAFSAALYGGDACFGTVHSRHASPLPGARVHTALNAGLDRLRRQQCVPGGGRGVRGVTGFR
jgi:3-oxoacyl-(acyl-carrier-protein) synthase